MNYFFDYLDDNKIKHVIHLGDLFDRRKFLNILTSSVCRNTFLIPLQERGIETHIISGNHDQYYKDTYEVNALDEFVNNRYSNIRSYNTPKMITLDGLDIQLMPWINPKNQIESFDRLSNTSAQVLMGHFEINGFELFRGVMSDHGLETHVFDRYDLVFSGHYHHKSSKNNIHYIGAFAEYTWSDYKDERGFTILDTSTREFQFIRNPHNIFQMITYDDSKIDDMVSVVQNMDLKDFKDKYVKVLCASKNNQYAFDMFVENLYSANPIDVSIIDDISLVTETEDTENIDQAQDTTTILTNYIKSLTLNVNNDKMVTFIHDIYNEALSSEHVI